MAQTRLERFIESLDHETRRECLEWVESRPPEIRELCRRFPPGTTIILDGKKAHLVGYAETDGDPGIYFSFVNPRQDYRAAVASKFYVCASHLGDEERPDESPPPP